MRKYTDAEWSVILAGFLSQGVFRERDLLELGLRRTNVRTITKRRGLHRLGRGLYSSRRFAETPDRMIAAAALRMPRAVVCLESAAFAHGLIDVRPAEVSFAVPRGAWVPVVRDLPVRVVRMSPVVAALDVEERDIEGVPVRLYGAAKTVADLLRFRRGTDATVARRAMEVLLGRAGGEARLTELAEPCRIAGVLRAHLAERRAGPHDCA